MCYLVSVVLYFSFSTNSKGIRYNLDLKLFCPNLTRSWDLIELVSRVFLKYRLWKGFQKRGIQVQLRLGLLRTRHVQSAIIGLCAVIHRFPTVLVSQRIFIILNAARKVGKTPKFYSNGPLKYWWWKNCFWTIGHVFAYWRIKHTLCYGIRSFRIARLR